MEYAVEVAVRVGPAAADPELGDRLLSALEEHPGLLSPIVAQDAGAGRITVSCHVQACDAWLATGAVMALRDALASLGVTGPLLELHVTSGDDELVTGAEIARRLGVSRERVRQWASVERYGFPAAVRRLGSAKVWRWADVARWDAERRGQDTERTGR